jgi:hypothetical protein
MNYLINKNADTHFVAGNGQTCTIDMKVVAKAVKDVNKTMKTICRLDKQKPKLKILQTAGMRNLSGSLGERFVESYTEFSNNCFIKNPNQDGYPDMLLMDGFGIAEYNEIKRLNRLRDKAAFTYWLNGGVEVKATCGSVPTAAVCLKRYNMSKPDLYDTRIDMLESYGWSAHHRDTTNLLGLLWDFDDGVPQIMAVFFGNTIQESDWGKVSVPKVGGRATNASGMARLGVKKMYDNWLMVKNDNRYVDFLNRYNHGNLIG